MKVFVLISMLLFTMIMHASSQEVYFVSNVLDSVNISNSNSSPNVYSVTKDSAVFTVKKVTESKLVADFQNRSSKNILFYVHGYGKELKDVYKRAIDLQNTYNVYVIAMLWTSKMPDGKNVTLKEARKTISNSMPCFHKMLSLKDTLNGLMPDAKYSILAHSLGNYYFELYSQEDFYQDHYLNFDNIILNSAAVDDKGHVSWLKNLAIPEHIYIISNKHDFILTGLQIFTSSKRPLGKKVRKQRLAHANYIDVSETVGFRRPVYFTHSYFTGAILDEEKDVLEMYKVILNGEMNKNDLSVMK